MTTMTEAAPLVLALLAGVLLGALFFGGLWWTIRRGLGSRWAPAWFAASLLLRTALVLAGFYLVGRNDWHSLLACLSGFVMGRLLVTRITRVPPAKDRRAFQADRP
jgi:F1F0 ATPase subunit 2